MIEKKLRKLSLMRSTSKAPDDLKLVIFKDLLAIQFELLALEEKLNIIEDILDREWATLPSNISIPTTNKDKH